MSELFTVSTLLIVLTVLVGLTNIITEVVKKITWNKIPSSLLAFIVAIVLSIVALFIFLAVMQYAFVWYYLFIAIIIGFMTAYAAMFGFDSLKAIMAEWTTLKANKSDKGSSGGTDT
jgi:pilus assembly protein TadC